MIRVRPKAVALVAVPAGVTTLTGPAVVPAGTHARICLGPSTTKPIPTRPAETLPNLTAVAPSRPEPVTVTT